MSDAMIGFLFGIGFGGWVYAKAYRSTGGNNVSALLMAAGAALVGFLLIITVLGIIF